MINDLTNDPWVRGKNTMKNVASQSLGILPIATRTRNENGNHTTIWLKTEMKKKKEACLGV